MVNKKNLSDEQLAILRGEATEAPFSGDLLYNEEYGVYSCVQCGAELFLSEHKFDSDSGWPSFYDVVSNDAVQSVEDTSLNMRRVAVQCANCGGHLGHVFNDAPQTPTNIRFCVNSCVLDFTEKDLGAKSD